MTASTSLKAPVIGQDAPAATSVPKPVLRINPAAKAWASFRENAANHRLTVLHEQGLYRHFRMSEQGTRMWSWDIVTWPDHLATSGDIADGFTFSRVQDMIEFFALANGKRAYYADGAPSIDFRYWAEKLQGDQRNTAKAYVHEEFVQFVTETLTERLEDGYHDGLTEEHVAELIAEVNSLEHYESEARDWLSNHEDEFPDSWENDFKDYTFHFQVACYAINAAVHAYLEHAGQLAA
ncbi:UNVERIFIED_ORG: hypothetical protein ABIB52_000705 [Arthrobacter sp. UYCu721]